MTSFNAFFPGLFVVSYALGQSLGSTGALQGSVTNELGAPVPGVVVTYNRVYKTVPAGNFASAVLPSPPVPPSVPNPSPPGNPPAAPVFPPVPSPPTSPAPGSTMVPGRASLNVTGAPVQPSMGTFAASPIMLVPAPGEAVVQGQVSTDATGAFAAPSLPVGDYSLCAYVPTAPYPDPCIWGNPVRVAVSAGGGIIPPLVLPKGVFLKVRVNDPSGLLPQGSSGPFQVGNKLLVGVIFGSGAYMGAATASVDSAGRDYQMVVPAGVPFKLRLFSRDVALADSGGNALSEGTLVPFQASVGQDQSFTFTISGPAQ
jgi:hypothetical protein